jgi:rhodanese-related sulfurtransferase
MRIIVTLLSFLFIGYSFAQNPKGFDGMCKENIQGTVPLATPTQLRFEASKNPNVVVLDARELIEFNTSHIKGAVFVGYDKFTMKNVQHIEKDSKIYIYCSVGYRSEKIGEKLLAAGYKKVYNLYGGIFNWANNGFPLVDKDDKSTKTVHGYDKDWAQWLNKKECQPVLK